MASSRKRSSSRAAADLVSRVTEQLAGVVKPGERLVVALSGGVDSAVLLDILQRLRARLRVRVSALHVNHQLSRNAARWATFCGRFCRERRIPLRRVKVDVCRADSVEAGARAARYEVYARQRCEYLVLAQHQDDQVETVLLQLLRGTGVSGLAGMPPVRKMNGGRRQAEGARRSDRNAAVAIRDAPPAILRPLLDATRRQILDYAQQRGIEWVEDESNADVRFARNFLRHEVLPLLARRFPAYRTTITRASRHFAETAGLLDELAAADGAGCLNGGVLEVAALRRLSPARARNLMRYFLAGHGLLMPAAAQLDEALQQALHGRRDAQVLIALGQFDVRRFEDRLYVVAALATPRPGQARCWRGERRLALPELGGVLVMTPGRGQGVSVARLGDEVSVRARRGGERLQPDCHRPRRTLKNLLQEARVPPWERERLPLVFSGRDLVWAPGIGIDCAYQAGPDELAVCPSWEVGGHPRFAEGARDVRWGGNIRAGG